MKPFRKIRATDRELDAVQTNIAQVLTPLSKSQIVDGTNVVDIVLAASPAVNDVPHKLGRVPEGWVITDRNSAATIYRTAWDSKTVTLTASAAVTCRIWFF